MGILNEAYSNAQEMSNNGTGSDYKIFSDAFVEAQKKSLDTWTRENLGMTLAQKQKLDNQQFITTDTNGDNAYQKWFNEQKAEAESSGQNFGWKSWQQALYYGTVGQEGWTNPTTEDEHKTTLGDVLKIQNDSVAERLNEAYKALTDNGYTGSINNMSQEQISKLAEVNQKRIANGMKPLDLSNVDTTANNGFYSAKQYEKWMNYPSVDYTPITTPKTEEVAVKTENNAYAGDTYKTVTVDNTSKINEEKNRQMSTAYYWRLIASGNKDEDGKTVFDSDQYKLLQLKTNMETGTDYLAWKAEHKKELKGLGEDEIYLKYKTAADGYNALVSETAATYLFYGTGTAKPTLEDYALLNGYTMKTEVDKTIGSYVMTKNVYVDANGNKIDEITFKNNYDQYIYDLTDRTWVTMHEGVEHLMPDALQARYDELNEELKSLDRIIQINDPHSGTILGNWREEDPDAYNKALLRKKEVENTLSALQTAHDYESVLVPTYAKLTGAVDLYGETMENWFYNKMFAIPAFVYNTADGFGLLDHKADNEFFGTMAEDLNSYNVHLGDRINTISGMYTSEISQLAVQLGVSAIQMALDGALQFGMGSAGFTGIFKSIDTGSRALNKIVNFLLPTGAGGSGSLLTMFARVFNSTYAQFDDMLKDYVDEDGNRLYSPQDIWWYAIKTAAVEYYAEKVFGGPLDIYNTGGGLFGGIGERLFRRAISTNKVAEAVVAIAASAIEEGAEEVIASFTEPAWRSQLFGTTYSEEFDNLGGWKTVGEAFVSGAALALVTGGPSAVSSVVTQRNVNSAVDAWGRLNSGEIEIGSVEWGNENAKIEKVLANGLGTRQFMNNIDFTATEQMNIVSKNIDNHINAVKQAISEGKSANEIAKMNEEFGKTFPRDYGDVVVRAMNSFMLKLDNEGKIAKDSNGNYSLNNNITKSLKNMQDWTVNEFKANIVQSIVRPSSVFASPSSLALYQATHSQEEVQDLADKALIQIMMQEGEQLQNNVDRNKQKGQSEEARNNPTSIYKEGQYRALNAQIGTDGNITVNQNGVVLGESQASEALGIETAKEINLVGEQSLEELYTEEVAVVDWMADREYLKEHCKDIAKSVTSAVCDGVQINGKNYVFAGWSASNAKISNNGQRVFRAMFVEESRWSDVAPVLMGISNYTNETLSGTNGWSFNQNKANINKFFVYAANAWSESKVLTQLNPNNFIMIPDVEGEEYTEYLIGEANNLNTLYDRLNERTASDKITDGSMYMIVDGPVNEMTTQQVRGGVGFKGNLVPVSLDGILTLMEENGVTNLGRDINGNIITKADLIQRVKSEGALYLAPESVVKLGSQYKTEDGKYDMESMYRTLEDKRFALRGKETYDAKHEEVIDKINKLGQLIRGQSVQSDEAKQAIANLASKSVEHIYSYLDQETDIEKIKAMFEILGITEKQNSDNALKNILSELLVKGDLEQLKSPVLRGMIRQACQDLIKNAKGGSLYVENTRCSLDRVCRDPYAVMERMMLDEANTDYNIDGTINKNQRAYGDLGFLKENEMIVPNVNAKGEGRAWRYPVQTGKNTVSFTRAELDEKLQKLYPKDTIVEAYRSAAQHVLDADYDGDTFAFTMCEDLIKLINATEADLKNVKLINFDHAKKGSVQIDNMDTFRQQVVEAVEAALTGNDLAMYDNWINAIYSCGTLTQVQKQQYAGIMGLAYIMCIDQVKTGIGIGNIEELYKANPEDQTLKSIYSVKQAVDLVVKQVSEAFNKEYGIKLNESASNAVADKTMSRVQTHSGNIFGELTNSVKKFSEGKMNLESTQDMTNISILENIRYNTGRIVASGTKTSTIALFMDVLSRAENSAQVAEMFYETMSKHGVTDKQVAFDYLMAGITDEMSKAQKAVEGKVDKTTIFGREFTSYSQALNFATNIVNNLGYQFTQDMNDAYHSDKNEAEANYIDLKTITNKKLEHLAKYMFMERQKDEAIIPRFKLESYVANMVDLASRVTYSDPKDGVVYTVNKAEADVIDYSAIKDFQSKMSDWLAEGTSISALKSKIRPLLYSVGLQEHEISNVLDNLDFDTATADTLTSEQSNKVVSAMARLSEMVCEAGVFYDFGTHGNQTRTIRDADGKERNVRVQQVEVGSVPSMVQKAMDRGVKFNWFNKAIYYTVQQNTVFTQIFGNGSETGLLIDHAIKHTDTNIAHQKGQCSLLARSFNIPSLNEELSKMEFKVNGEKVDGTELSAIDIMIARALYEYKEEKRTASLNNLLTGLYSFSNYSTWYSNKDSDCKVIIEANARLVELNNKANGRGLTVAEEQERAEILSQGATALEHMKANIESMMGEDQRFALAKKFVQLISQRTCPLIEDAAWRNYGEMFKLNWEYYIPEHTRNVDDRTTHGSYDRYTMRASDMSHSFGRNGSGNSGTVVYNVFEMMEEYSSKVFENYYNNMLADQLSKLFNYKIGEKTLTEPKEVKDYIDNLRGWSQEKGAINKAISAAGSFIYGVQLSHSWGAVAKQHASYHYGKGVIDTYMYTTWNGDKIEYTNKNKTALTNPWDSIARQIAKDVGKPLLGGTDQSKLNNLQIDPETGTYGNNIISYFADWESRYGYQFIDSNSIKYINSLGSKGINVSDINTTFRLGVEAMVRCIELCAEVNGMTREAVYEMVQKQDYSLKDKNGNSILKDFNSNIDTLMADVMASQPHNSKAQNTALQRGALGNIFGMYKTQPLINWDACVNAIVQLTTLDSNDTNIDYMRDKAWKQAGTAVRANLGSIVEIGVIEALLTLIRPNKRKKYYDEDGDFRWDMLGDKILSSAEASLMNNIPFIGSLAANYINMKYNEEYGLYNGYLVKTENGYTIWFKEDGTVAEYGKDYVTTEDALKNGLHQEADWGKWAKGMFGAISSGESYGENIIDGVESFLKNGLDFTDYNQKQGMLILSELLIYLATKAGTGEGLIVPISNMMTDIDSMHQIGDNVYDHLTGFKTNARKEGTKLSDNLGVMLNDLFGIVIEDTTKTVMSDVVAINSNLSDSTLDEFMAYKEEWDNAYRMAHNGSSPSGADNFYQLVVSAYDDLSVHGLMTRQDANKLLMSYYQTNVVDKYDPTAGKKMDDPVTFDDIYNNPIYSNAGQEWGLTYDAAPFFINAYLSGDYANLEDATERFWDINIDGGSLSTDEAKAAIRNGNITSQAEIDMFGNDKLNDLYNSFMPEWTFVRLGADENDNGEASATEVLNYLKAGGSYDVETLQRFLDNETTLSRTGSTYKGIMAYINKGSNTTSASTSSNMPKVELPKFDYSIPSF